ncbi:MAG TPA: hypothetical protein VER76_17110, partial [Pyrinomonadaceae bacterium]|nr:hypothetical protein [Pyrinomonadaceae bacterium]
MLDLKDHLETLQDLNETRDRAKDLRERGLRSLRRIKNTRTKDELGNPINKVLPVSKEGSDLTIEERERLDDDEEFFKNWICSGNEAEVALLVKVQNHQNLSEYEETNDHAEAHPELIGRLKNIDLKTLFPSPYTQDVDSTVPVLVAARAMQALTARPETVFSKASMYCYYRVIRELYYAAAPDWTIGAARAGRGGRTSAFITSECIRAILAFESAIRRTSEYFVSTRALYKRYLHLEAMLTNVGIAPDSEHTLSKWADKEIERMWLDWYISTNPRNGAIALYCETPNDIFPFPPKLIEPPVINMKSVREAFLTLKDRISQAMDIVYDNICEARGEIIDFRVKEFENIADGIDSKSRTESAHLRASKIINHALLTAIMVKQDRHTELEYSDLQKLFDYLIKEYEDLPDKIHQVLEPAKRYVHTVLDRELAIAYSGKTFDAGELVFAAMAFGAATHWRENDKLKQACDALVKA